MPFNSNSYHRNKARREALSYLERARDIKRRLANGIAYEWEASGIRHAVEMARSRWRQYLIFNRLKQMDKDFSEMSAPEFIAKYGSR